MPIYDYKCKCGTEQERIARPDETLLLCDKCGGDMVRQFHSRFGISMGVGAYGYYDDNLQTYVATNAEKKRIMQAQGVQEKFGKGWR